MSRLAAAYYTVVGVEGDDSTELRSFESTDIIETLRFFLKNPDKYNHILVSRSRTDAYALIGQEYCPQITPDLRERLTDNPDMLPPVNFVMQLLDFTLP